MAKTGRPTKYNPDVMLPILDQAAREGWFIEQVANALGVHKSTIYDWCNPDSDRYEPEFSDAIKDVERGRDDWLISRARGFIDGTQPEDANSSVLIFTLKNVLNWRDKSEVEQTNTNRNIVIED